MKKEPEVPVSTAVVFNPAQEQERLLKWIPNLDAATAARLVQYEEEIHRLNKTLSLVPSSSLANLGSSMIADAGLASRLIFPQLVPNEALYDFGSGSGTPGLVFAALYPQVAVVLVDRDIRKMDFCKNVAATLGLKNVTIQIKNVEDLAEKSVKNAVARELASFSKALMLPRKQMGKGAKFFHMKSDGWANELASMPSQMFSHWSPNLLGSYRLPDSSAEMFVVLTDKTAD